MKKQLFTLAAIALISSGVKAQSDSAKQGQETKAEKHSGKGQAGRTTIVISGDKVTVNGEEIKDLRGQLKGFDGHLSFNDTRRLVPELRAQLRKQGLQSKNNWQDLTFPDHRNKAMLGVNVAKDEKGARITDIVKGSGAEKAGLRKDDIITAIGATTIADGEALVKTIGRYQPEEKVEITLLRSGQEKKLTAALGRNDQLNSSFHWNEDPDFSLSEVPYAFGFDGESLNRLQLNGRPRFGFGIQDNESDDGAVVTHVKEESIAAKAGLQVNDIITEAAGTPVKTTADLKRILSGNKDHTAIDLKISRDGKSKSLTLKVPKRIQSAEL